MLDYFLSHLIHRIEVVFSFSQRSVQWLRIGTALATMKHDTIQNLVRLELCDD